MTMARSGAHASRHGTVREILTEATLPALSAVLVNRGIDPRAILAIVEMRGPAMTSPMRAQFRVLYEAH